MPHAVLYLDRTIDSSHVIPDHPGKCSRLHGHTYRFQVWVAGQVDAGTGMVVDFYDVKREIDAWDHRHLNDVVDFVPTAELLAHEMRRRIQAHVHGDGAGVLVRLWETPGAFAQCGWLPADPDAPADATGAAAVAATGFQP